MRQTTQILRLGIGPGLGQTLPALSRQWYTPSWLETADMSPIFKKGNTSTPYNYRPISLTPSSCMILEHILLSNTMTYFDNNNILTDSQHGFRGRSCDSQLLTIVNNLTWTSKSTLDFSKASPPESRSAASWFHCSSRPSKTTYHLGWSRRWLSSR